MGNSPSNWESVDIEELPKYKPTWVQRILGYDDWDKPNRDEDKIEQEYNEEKYGSLLTNFRGEQKSWKDVRDEQFPPDKELIVSSEGGLYETTMRSVYETEMNYLSDRISSVLEGDDILVELGSGYGAKLGSLWSKLNDSYPNVDYIGGEYSENAVILGNELFSEKIHVNIQEFNYYDDKWSIIEDLDPYRNIIVFTRHSIEQLPSANPIVENIERISQKINHFMHFEPVYEFRPKDSLLGIFRNKYTEINDYNTDLYSELSEINEISIVDKEYDIIGLNPLNPTSIIHWN